MNESKSETHQIWVTFQKENKQAVIDLSPE